MANAPDNSFPSKQPEKSLTLERHKITSIRPWHAYGGVFLKKLVRVEVFTGPLRKGLAIAGNGGRAIPVIDSTWSLHGMPAQNVIVECFFCCCLVEATFQKKKVIYRQPKWLTTLTNLANRSDIRRRSLQRQISP